MRKHSGEHTGSPLLFVDILLRKIDAYCILDMHCVQYKLGKGEALPKLFTLHHSLFTNLLCTSCVVFLR